VAKEVKIRLYRDGAFIRTVIPRDDAGHWQAGADVNGDPRARRSADVACEALGLADMASGLFRWLERWIPDGTPVAETTAEAVELGRRVSRRVGSNNGRKAGWIDLATPNGVGVNLKLCSSEDHDEVILATLSEKTAHAQVAQAAEAPMRILQVQAVDDDGFYAIDLNHLKWNIINPQSCGFDGDLAAMFARKRGRGRAGAGVVLPRSWAITTPGNNGANMYVRPKIRGLKLSDTGWQTGTIDDLHRALLAL
jgi:hypothetical protein